MPKKFSKAELQSLVPSACDIFKSIMPPINASLPKIYFADGRNFLKVRREALSNIGCPEKALPAEDSIMEYIHGEQSSAILIRQNLLPDNDEQNFYWFFWHELGHWYTRNIEPDDLRRYNDPNLLDTVTLGDRLRGVSTTITQLKQEGYWFWQEFIAEAISQYVSGEYDAQQFDNSQPIEWRSSVYFPIIIYLDSMLDAAFSPDDAVDEYALAHYFANLLMRDVIVLFEKAAEAGKLISNIPDDFELPDDPDDPMDPTRISDIEYEEFQPVLRELHTLLKSQVQKEHFWEIDENFLLELGRHIKKLRDIKIQIIAATELEGQYDDTSI